VPNLGTLTPWRTSAVASIHGQPRSKRPQTFRRTRSSWVWLPCQHVYGIGVYVAEQDVWGHVNVTAMGVERVGENFADHPPIGTHLHLRVLGRTHSGQLRLAVA
jgi:hypothetical protein